MTVLIVDDDLGIRETLAEVLEEEGYPTRSAASAEQALAVLKAHGGTIELILLDYGLPGIDGRTLAEQLGPSIPIVGMTATVGAELLPNAVGVLSKPFGLEQLLEAVAARVGA